MNIKSGLIITLCLAAATLGGSGEAQADNVRSSWGHRSGYDESRYDRGDSRSYSRHYSHYHEDRGYHRGNGYKQSVITLSPHRVARYQTIYYSPGYPRAIEAYYQIGNYLPRHLRCEEPPRSVVAVLPPVSRGTRYVMVDQDVYLIAEASRQILDAVVLLSSVR